MLNSYMQRQGLMPLQKFVPETKFKMLTSKYTTRTGLPLVLINTNGDIIYSGKKCAICEQLLAIRKSVLTNNCRLKMLKVVEETFRWGDGYITNCPLGLIMFAVPIVFNKKLIGGFLSGFAIFPEMRKDFNEEVTQNLENFSDSLDELKLKGLKLKVFSLRKSLGLSA